MSDIELVIKIPKHYYENNIKQDLPIYLTEENIIKILPKGHGDLKDADVMINKLCTHEASELFGSITCAEIMDFINNEKPIIEADKEDKYVKEKNFS